MKITATIKHPINPEVPIYERQELPSGDEAALGAFVTRLFLEYGSFSTITLQLGETCPDCGSSATTSYEEDYRFSYADVEQTVRLTARITMRRCNACRFTWRDHTSEAAIDKVVKDYLAEIARCSPPVHGET